MKKDEFIERWGTEAYEKWQKQIRDWKLANREKVRSKQLIYNRTGIQGSRKAVRTKHQKMWRKFKRIIAPASQLNYLWIPETSEYKCVALVETDQCQYAYKDVINIPVIHRGPILKYLITKCLIPKCLIRNRQVQAFTEQELQAGI